MQQLETSTAVEQRVFSGVQPTGEPTLGTILGAVKNWVEEQGPNAYFCIVDLHALTKSHDPAELQRRTFGIAAMFIAVGLDPNVCNLFVQSRVAEHAQLAWILECHTSFGELSRMTQFKDQYSKTKAVSAGFFTYPALMAADILLYDTDIVPVGDDQSQHVELTRNIAQRFNTRYGEVFTVPEARIRKAGARIRDLQQPTAKMSKSANSNGTVLLSDDLNVIRRKFMRAVTDTETEVRYAPKEKPGVSNLLEIYAAIEGGDPAQHAAQFSSYKSLKEGVAESVCSYLAPIKQRYEELMSDTTQLLTILEVGERNARHTAARTLARVKNAVGLI